MPTLTGNVTITGDLTVEGSGGGGAVESVNGETGAVVLDAADVSAEPALGNPASDDYVLSSTAAGVRSWVAQSGGGGSSPGATLALFYLYT